MNPQELKGLTIVGCARCGKDHDLVFRSFAQPLNLYDPEGDGPYEFWAMCPYANEPVLMYDDESPITLSRRIDVAPPYSKASKGRIITPAFDTKGRWVIELRLNNENLGFMPIDWKTYPEAVKEADRQFKLGANIALVTIFGPDGYTEVIKKPLLSP